MAAERETREVRVDDPSLPPEVRKALSKELQEAVGAERVEVPADTPHRERDVNAQRGPSGFLGRNRLLFGITGIGALVVGAIIALAVKEWWVLLIPVGVHAIGTLIVGFLTIQMTTQPESMDPALTARLESEGVDAPERAFNDLVQEFTASDAAGGGGEEADAEDTSVVMGFQWAIIIGLAVTSLVAAFVVEMGWLLAVVMLPVCGAWAAYQVIAKRKGGAPASRRRTGLLVLATVLFVELLTVVVMVLGSRS